MNTDDRVVSIAEAIEAFLNAKQKGNDSGNYRRLAENVLGRWNDWLQQRGITNLDRIDTQTMRRYAQRLRQRFAHARAILRRASPPQAHRRTMRSLAGFSRGVSRTNASRRIPHSPAARKVNFPTIRANAPPSNSGQLKTVLACSGTSEVRSMENYKPPFQSQVWSTIVQSCRLQTFRPR